MQYVVRISPCKNRSWLAEIRSLRGVMAFNELQVRALRTVEALARDVLGDRGEPSPFFRAEAPPPGSPIAGSPPPGKSDAAPASAPKAPGQPPAESGFASKPTTTGEILRKLINAKWCIDRERVRYTLLRRGDEKLVLPFPTRDKLDTQQPVPVEVRDRLYTLAGLSV
jgi:hypothetical protein